MSSMNDDAETMASTAKRELDAARASTSLITLSSAEFQVALDPLPENRAIVHKVVDEQIKLFKERVEDFSKAHDEKTRAMMPAIKEAMTAYETSMEKTLCLADETKRCSVIRASGAITDFGHEQPSRRGQTAHRNTRRGPAIGRSSK